MNPSVDAGNPTFIGWDESEYQDETIRRSLEGHRPVVANVPLDGLYEGSNGHYYTACQISTKLRTNQWKPCIRQREPDRQLVETSDGGLLLLIPTDELPAWAEIRVDDRGTRVVDTRRSVPE